MTKELKQLILSKCEENEKLGFNYLTDSDVDDIIEEAEIWGIPCGRKELTEAGIINNNVSKSEAVLILENERNKFCNDYINHAGLYNAYTKAIEVLKGKEDAFKPNKKVLFYCGKCGARLKRKFKYCNQCGGKIAWDKKSE